MYVPAKYVLAVLQMQGLSSRQFWEAIIPQIQVNNKVEECRVFIDWMQVAVTLTNVRVPHSQPPREVSTVGVIKLNLVILMMDLVLHWQHEDYEQRFGYEIQCRGQYGSGYLTACTSSSKVNVMPQVADQGKCPLDHWPETLPTLMALIDMESKEDLPEVYSKIA